MIKQAIEYSRKTFFFATFCFTMSAQSLAIASSIGVDVEVGVNDKTRIWADQLYNKLDNSIKERIGDFDSLLAKHGDQTFSNLIELIGKASSELSCSQENFNQQLLALIEKLAYKNEGFWFFSKKNPLYPACAVNPIPVSSTGLLRKTSECILNEIVNDEENDIRLDFLAAHYSDLSSAYYAGWCIKIKQPAYSNEDNSLLDSHFRISSIHEALNELYMSEPTECKMKSSAESCFGKYVDYINGSLEKIDEIDKLGVDKEIAEIQATKKMTSHDYLESMGELKVIHNFVQKRRDNRIDILSEGYKKIKLKYVSISPLIKSISTKYAYGNKRCLSGRPQEAESFWSSVDQQLVSNMEKIHNEQKQIHENIKSLISQYDSEDVNGAQSYIDKTQEAIFGWREIDPHSASHETSHDASGNRSETPCIETISRCGTVKTVECI